MVPSTIKKVLGTVKDQTSISIAKVSSNITPKLDVAIVKATSHDEDPAEERHIREILNLTTYSKGNVSDCVVALSRRLRKTHDWIVALKSLMLVHRLLSNGHPYFQSQIYCTTHKGKHLLNMSDFHDEAHSNSCDYTAFVRAYALYLDQRLQMIFKEEKQQGRYEYGDTFTYKIPEKRPQIHLMYMELEKVLDKMCELQQLLDCLLGLRPTGIAKNSRLIMVALYPIARDSFQLYADLCEILAVLLDRFFYMEYADCVKSFKAYASAAKQINELGNFYSWCKDVRVAKSSVFPEVQRVSGALLGTLEEFMRDRARKPVDPPKVPQPCPKPVQWPVPGSGPEPVQGLCPEPFQGDLIDLSEDDPSLPAVEHESTGLALTLFSDDAEKGRADWEVALVESANLLSKQKANLPNGVGPLVLNNMYEQGNKQQILMQENIMWQQYEENAMQDQTNIERVNNGYMHDNAGMVHFSMSQDTNGSSGFYFPPPY